MTCGGFQKKTKKRTGFSTDVNVLTTLAEHHELPAMVLRYETDDRATVGIVVDTSLPMVWRDS